jgi:hypothetical protein
MENRIIELTKTNESSCLVCVYKKATTNVRIKRPKYNDSIFSFHVCDECLAKMQKDIEICK